jgi:RNAse (barnase) inhibitor barstar
MLLRVTFTAYYPINLQGIWDILTSKIPVPPVETSQEWIMDDRGSSDLEMVRRTAMRTVYKVKDIRRV